MRISVIIPVFNEEKTITQILKKVFSVSLPKGFTKEVIVINDGSTDETLNLLKKSRYKFILINHLINQGKGQAIRSGVDKAAGALILIQDADLEYDPKDYQRLLEPFTNPQTQVVYGTRLINYPLQILGQKKTPLPLHLLANKLLTYMTNVLYGDALTDMETCYKVVSLSLVKQLHLQARRFDFEPEITAKILKRNINIIEVPIKVKPRDYKDGKKIGWKDGLIAVLTLVKYRIVD